MYSDRYWKMFNEIDGNFDDVAISTFKVGLPAKHGLRKSLTGKPITSVRQLMDRIDKYKRLRKTNNRGKERLRLSLKREGISGRTDTITKDLIQRLATSLAFSPGLQEKRLNTTKKVVTIITNVVVISVIATTKKSMQAVVINSEATDLCNTRFSLQ